jgi:hypothetical protein
MRFDSRPRAAAGLLLVAVAIAATATAAAAPVLDVHDEGKLKFITSEGSEIIDRGPATGTIPGKVKVHFIYNGNPNVSASFTIEGHAGSISGKAKGTLNNPNSREPSFRGKFSITGGTRRYAQIHGTGELFGVFTRRGSNKYGLVVQTIGNLPY